MSGVNPSSNILSISLRIQGKMKNITSIIKDLESSLSESELPTLRKLLYRSMDSLTELELSLLQQQVARFSKPTQ
jgi:hypothetical protein